MHLTKRQKEIFDFIQDHLEQEGYAPSLEEIGERFGLSSVATVHKHVQNLVDKGLLRKAWNRITERVGAEMLRIAFAVDRLVADGSSLQGAAAKLAMGGAYDKTLLNTLCNFHGLKRSDIVRAVRVQELVSFMVLDEDVRARNGNVIVSKGRELSVALIERLKNWRRGVGIVEPIRVRIPAGLERSRTVTLTGPGGRYGISQLR